MSEYPRKHEVRPELGITEEVARQLDAAAAEMESGGVGGEVVHDPSSETLENLHAADIGYSSQVVHRGISSNEQVMFGAMVEQEKNEDPDIEHSEAYDRAAEKFDQMVGDEEEDSNV
ncbi:MAG TPA: hypothetical protein VNA27_12480 [Rubrobacteraceae bacterium]|nr:hypothetical protein [Rubrobacteraceae bacterium]